MTRDSRTKNTVLRKLHASVLSWRRTPAHHYLLSDEDFRFAADCERMRVDRNGSVLSLLLIRLHQKQTNEKDIAFLGRVLEGRLRVTDTPGQLKDGRVAILLPDTTAAGAWKVATDISEVYPAGPGRPECEVLVYQSNDGKDRDDFATPNKNSAGDKGSTERDSGASNKEPATNSSDEVSTGDTVNCLASDQEFFFALAHPRWKRSLDLLGGTVGLIASLPILFVAAVMIKMTSRGPAFFRQQREGHGGHRFTIWKLRTMHVDAAAQQQELRKHSHQDGPAFKMNKDPRTTIVGRFLRWTSMDELPQFWNVLRGDMTLVGPRPLPIEESLACEGWHRRRLQVVPGMTCTWQVCERGNVSFDEWVRMDLRYIKDYTVLEDVKLLIMTIPSLLKNHGIR